jgi:A-macroglobulin TED domain
LLDYCAESQNSDGSFKITGYEFKPANPFIETIPSRNVRGACFFALAFLKHKDYTKSYKPFVDKIFHFVRTKPNIDNFAAAVCAYAKVHLEEKTDQTYLRQLEIRSYSTGNSRYWDNKKDERSSDSVRVLISSYVAMTYYKLNEISSVKPIINFLIKHQKADGGFGDIYTSAVGLEPLALMAEYYAADKTSMMVKVWTLEDQPKMTRVNSNDVKGKVTILDLPIDMIKDATVMGSGFGFAQVTWVYSFSVIYDKLSDYFAINVATTTEDLVSKITICARQKKETSDDENSDKVILMKVNMPSGFAFLAETSDLRKQSNHIKVRV